MDDTVVKNERQRASYPAASLALCLRKAAQAAQALPALVGIPRGWATQDEMAQAFGYKGFVGNSAPKGLIAALRHFELVERGGDKRLRFKAELVSALADVDARARLIWQVWRRPSAYQALRALCAEDAEPARQDLAQHLIDVRGFRTRPAALMAGNFLEDLALARSVSSHVEASDFLIGFSTPSGTAVRLASDRELTSSDYAYLEKALQERRLALSSVDAPTIKPQA